MRLIVASRKQGKVTKCHAGACHQADTRASYNTQLSSFFSRMYLEVDNAAVRFLVGQTGIADVFARTLMAQGITSTTRPARHTGAVDTAPTLAHILHARPPAAAQGRVLTQALH